MDGLMMDFQLTIPHLLKRAETFFGRGELPRARHRRRVRRPVETLVGAARDDLARAEVRLGALQEMRKRQLKIHHQAVHG